MWNLHLPGAPTVDFHRFFDGENITQRDLVAWINVGMHHLVRILHLLEGLYGVIFAFVLTELRFVVSDSPKLRILPTPKPPSQLPGMCPLTTLVISHFSLISSPYLMIYQRYSFVLTPLNYFDYDISMELRNAILLREPGRTGDPYSFDDNGVKLDYGCLPELLAPFAYEKSAQWVEGLGGSVGPEDARRASEMYLRVKIGV
jgi:primary-amine oxidase